MLTTTGREVVPGGGGVQKVLEIQVRSGIERIDLIMILLGKLIPINTKTDQYRTPEDSGGSPVICSLEQTIEQRLRRYYDQLISGCNGLKVQSNPGKTM